VEADADAQRNLVVNLVVNLEQENITDLINRALEEDIVKLNYKLIKSII
jgi:hypothetical protein